MRTYEIYHVVKGEDTNGHGTLFAGQGAKWIVESGFIAAADMTSPRRIVCLNIHGALFRTPVPLGTIIRFESKVVLAGRTSLLTYVKAVKGENEEFVVDAYLTFIHVDSNGRPIPHGVTLVEPESEEDRALQEKARMLLAR
jgi:acyl-CoA hydrolase